MLIGTDIGTSGTKTVLFDLNGNALASDTQEYPLYQPQNGWAEQDPQDWWNAVAVSIKNVIAKSGVNASEIKGIGLSGQMHGLVMLDKDDKVLRRSIIWCDQRTQKECDEITSVVGKEKLIEITANPALTGFTASKLRWVMNNEPDVFAKCTKVMLPKDYIRYMLTGEFATEVSDASGMQFMDIKNRCWSKELLDILGIDIGLLPIDVNKELHSGCPRHWSTLIQRIEVWSCFMPMWVGIATEEQARRMVSEHYLNEKTFYAPYGIRTLSKMEKMYAVIKSNNPSCWLGPIWVISNYMMFDALVKYGYIRQARDLAEKTITLLGRDIEINGEMHEYYDPESGIGINNPGFQNWNMLAINMLEWLSAN
jgi:hypothetical protein